jgi:hypothetical protein
MSRPWIYYENMTDIENKPQKQYAGKSVRENITYINDTSKRDFKSISNSTSKIKMEAYIPQNPHSNYTYYDTGLSDKGYFKI